MDDERPIGNNPQCNPDFVTIGERFKQAII